MTKDEALKLALEALEQAWEAMTDYMAAHKTMPAILISASAVSDKACTTIKEALTQPWQGLTKEEINSALSKYQNWYDFAAHLENILKEKNQ